MAYLASLIYGYRLVENDGSALPQRSTLNFKGTGVTATDNPSLGTTDVTITAGSSSGITDLVADVSATGPGVTTATVQGFRGRTVASTTPSDAGLYVYASPTSTWNPVVMTGDATMDRTGAVTVVGLQGYPVSTTAPLSGEVLAWDAGNGWWYPSASAGGGITQLTGDITAGPGTGSQVAAIAAGVIVNADVNASAAIAGTKISPDFGSQNVQTTGTLTVGAGGSGAIGTFGGGGSDGFARIGTRVGGASSSALYLMANSGVPSSSNYSMLCDGTALEINAVSGGVYLEVAGSAYFVVTSSLVTVTPPMKFVNASAPSTPSGGADAYANGGHLYSINSDGDTFQLS